MDIRYLTIRYWKTQVAIMQKLKQCLWLAIKSTRNLKEQNLWAQSSSRANMILPIPWQEICNSSLLSFMQRMALIPRYVMTSGTSPTKTNLWIQPLSKHLKNTKIKLNSSKTKSQSFSDWMQIKCSTKWPGWAKWLKRIRSTSSRSLTNNRAKEDYQS